MKKHNFAFIGMISWIALVIFLSAIFIYGLTNSPFAINKVSNKYEGGKLITEQKFPINNIENLNIDTTYQSINIKISDKDEIEIYQYGDPKYDEEFQSSINGKNLTINIPYKAKKNNFSSFSIGVYSKLDIALPEKYKDDISLTTSSGSISIKGKYNLKDTSINSKSGSIQIDTINASSAVVQSTSGSINIDNIDCQKDCGIQASSGSITINDINSEKLSIKTSSGSINGQNLNINDNLDLSASSGTIKFNEIKSKAFNIGTSSGSFVSNNIKGAGNIKCTSGSIRLNSFIMLGDTDISSSSGSTKISMASSENYKLEINTTSGSIHCSMPVNYENKNKNKATGIIGNGQTGTLSISATSGSINID